jgi:membrane-bound metal-dependent hydrolase YbcI (DUF457 family)
MVFRDPALSYGMVALGALLPDAVDLIVGGVGPGHSVVIGALALTGVMLATRGRRRLRRRLLGLPLGFLLHLVLDATWAADLDVLWWPAGGFDLQGRVPSFDRPAALLLVLEVLGILAGGWAWRAIRWSRQQRRSERDRRGAAPQ